MDLNEVINFIKEKTNEFQNSERLNFNDFIKPNWRPKPNALEFVGVYVIYENDKEIYVGSAGKGKHELRYRIANLFQYSKKRATLKKDPFSHTLTKKLIRKYKRFKNIGEVRDFYLNMCSFKMVETNTIQQSRVLEATLNLLLNPSYND